MGSSQTSSDDGESPVASVSSVLGFSGPLRFRLHGATQKAHVVLRRVEIPDDSGEDGDTRATACYSLFAQKRIEVKPGKEILISLGGADDLFADRPVVFEADLCGKDEASDGSKCPLKSDNLDVPADQVVPPKMRKTWVRRGQDTEGGTCK